MTTVAEPLTIDEVASGLETFEEIDFNFLLVPSCQAWLHRDRDPHPAQLKILWICEHGPEHELWCREGWNQIPTHPFDTVCEWTKRTVYKADQHTVRNGKLNGKIVGEL